MKKGKVKHTVDNRSDSQHNVKGHLLATSFDRSLRVCSYDISYDSLSRCYRSNDDGAHVIVESKCLDLVPILQLCGETKFNNRITYGLLVRG